MLTESGIKTVPHPPNRSDLASDDIWLLPKLKENLKGSHFENIKRKKAVTRALDTFILDEGFHGIFTKWLVCQKAEDPTLKEVRVLYFFEINVFPEKSLKTSGMDCVYPYFFYFLSTVPVPIKVASCKLSTLQYQQKQQQYSLQHQLSNASLTVSRIPPPTLLTYTIREKI